MSCLLMVAFAGLLITACNSNNGDNPSNSQEPVHEHTYSSSWSSDETYHWHAATCEHKSEIKDKEEHTFGSWIIDKEATEYESGSKHRYCGKCEYRVDETIQKLEHTHKPGNPTEENRIEADCTHDGSYDLVVKCTECQEELSRTSHTIPSLGHDYHDFSAKEATCTEDGWNAYHQCSRCGDNNKVVIPATGHQHTNTRQDNQHPATCTQDGYYDLVTYCEDDNAVLNTERIIIPATGHNWGSPTYEWEFGDYLTKCIASRVCSNDTSHIETENAYATSSTITDASYSSEGLKRYSATFNNPAFEDQTKDVVLPIKDMLKYTLAGDGTYYKVTADSTAIYGDIEIPAVHNELPVKVVDDFFQCSDITSVIIPNTVETIGDNAFQGCSSLLSVTLNEGLKTIGHYAFSECSHLTSITVPDSVTSLGMLAFSYCSNLKTANIGKNIDTFDDTFYQCDSLEKLTIPFIGRTRTSDRYLGYLFMAHDYLFNKTYVPATLKELIITNCDSIDNHALYGCENIESLTLPFIGGSANENQYLGYIYGATSVDDNGSTVPTALKTVKLVSPCSSIPDKAFVDCATIENVDIAESVTSIGWRAFYGCDAIESLLVPASVVSIGNSAFGFMSSLLSVTILGDNLTLGLSVFSGSYKLQSIRIPESNYNYSTSNEILYNKDKTRLICCPGAVAGDIVIPDSVTSIEEYAFYGCSQVTSISMPDSLTEFENNTFAYCSSLETINIPSGLTTIGKAVFAQCSSLEEISLPNSVQSIGEYCFSYCSSLASFNVPTGVQSLPKAMFLDCTSLSSITIPNSVKSIGMGAFLRCSAIKTINVPDSVTSIEVAAFEGCTSLESFDMPYYVTNLNQEIFSGCTSLKEVTLSVYDLGTIGQSAFYNCTSLETIELSGITSIGNYAFYGCTSLWGIGFDETLKSIGNYALYNCTSLTDIIYVSTTTNWNKVTKGTSWKYGVPATVVQCSNGNVSI